MRTREYPPHGQHLHSRVAGGCRMDCARYWRCVCCGRRRRAACWRPKGRGISLRVLVNASSQFVHGRYDIQRTMPDISSNWRYKYYPNTLVLIEPSLTTGQAHVCSGTLGYLDSCGSSSKRSFLSQTGSSFQEMPIVFSLSRCMEM